MKYLVIRHDGNGTIKGEHLSIENYTAADFDNEWDYEGVVAFIPINSIPVKLLKQIINLKNLDKTKLGLV